LKVARELAAWLRERFGERIVDVGVYGSVARDEADEDSDIDVLVLLTSLPSREEEDEMGWRSYELDLAHGTLTQYLVETKEQWDSALMWGTLLRESVERDGVRV
jgi:predicted nucleotidyltransferase